MIRYSTLLKVEAGLSKMPDTDAEYEDEGREHAKTDPLPGLSIEIFSYSIKRSQFSHEQKKYLVAAFKIGEITERKTDRTSVSKEM